MVVNGSKIDWQCAAVLFESQQSSVGLDDEDLVKCTTMW